MPGGKTDLQTAGQKHDRFEDMFDYFKRSEAALWSVANSLEQEVAADNLIDQIFETRDRHVRQVNLWDAETLIEVTDRLALWVLQNYPDKSREPRNEWDRLILNAYFQLAGFIGVEPVREE